MHPDYTPVQHIFLYWNHTEARMVSDMDSGDSERSSRLRLELSGTKTMWSMHNGPALTLYVSRL